MPMNEEYLIEDDTNNRNKKIYSWLNCTISL